MKNDYKNTYISKYTVEKFNYSYSFSSDVNGTVTSCTVKAYDSNGVDKSASMLSNIVASTPNVNFTIEAGKAGETYRLELVASVPSDSEVFVSHITCEVFGEFELNSNVADSEANSYVTVEEANAYIRSKYGHTDTWDVLDINGKRRILAQACREIDRYNFIDERYYDNQSLEFPRNTHNVITGKCATPITDVSFKNTSFTSDTYGSNKANANFWKYGSVHITNGTPLYDVRKITSSSVTTDIVTVNATFTANPTVNTSFIAFEPLPVQVREAQCEQALHIAENTKSDTLFFYKDAGAKEVEIGDVRVQFTGNAGGKLSVSPTTRRLLSPWIRKVKRVLRA